MARVSRRAFINWVGALATWLGLTARRAEASNARSTVPSRPVAHSALDPALLAALAEVVLPSELGRDGAARAARGFAAWVGGHEEAAELLHPYGSPEVTFASALPTERWAEQLADLDRAARAQHRGGIASLGRVAREELVRNGLRDLRFSGMPPARSAQHVAVALASHYFGSPEATDLCYRAQIRKNQCRPLVNASRKPLPLARGDA